MTYIKNTWVDQAGQVRYTETDDSGYKVFTANYDEVTELGTPVNATNMNHIEQGIYDNDLHIGVLSNLDTTVKTDLVSAINEVKNTGSSFFIGQIIQSTTPLIDAGIHILDGSLLTYGSYQDVIDYYGDLYNSGDYPGLFTTEATWQTTVTTYGSCGKFVYDNVNNTLRLPKISDILQGTTDATALGDLVEAGVPNITGNCGNFHLTVGVDSGAFYGRYNSGNSYSGGGSYPDSALAFDASRSSSLYKNGFNKVQPQTIKVLYYIVIATTTKTQIQVDIDEIATDLNGKADVDLTNVNATGDIKMAHNAMPSWDTYVDLTLGASGATYTAPADGYFLIDKTGLDQQYLYVGGAAAFNLSASGTQGLCATIPVRKGQEISISYNATGVTNNFKFIYAVGSESEA